MSASVSKAEIRREFLIKREGMEREEVHIKSRAIFENLINCKVYQQSSGLFTYVSFGNEPDTYAVIRLALDAGKKVYVPCWSRGCGMKAVRIEDIKELAPKGSMGIPQPVYHEDKEASAGDIDLIIAPGLAFDRSLNRIGFGAGYYDGYLKSAEGFKLALCYEWQVVSRLETESHDVPMDALVTEKRIYSADSRLRRADGEDNCRGIQEQEDRGARGGRYTPHT